MELVYLVIWLLLAGAGLILLPAVLTTPGAGLVGLAGSGGLVASILCIALGAPDWTVWAQVGMAVGGILGGTLAARWICDDRFSSGSAAEIHQAGALGIALPVFGVLLFLLMLLAVHAIDPVV